MNLRRLAALSSGMVVLAVIAATIALLRLATRASEGAESMGQAAEGLNAVYEIRTLLRKHERERLVVGLAPDEAEHHDFVALEREYPIVLSQAKQHIGSEEEAALFEELDRRARRYFEETRRASRALRDPLAVYLALSPLLVNVGETIDELLHLNRSQAVVARAAVLGSIREGKYLVTAFFALLLLGLTGFFALAYRYVYKPLIALLLDVDALMKDGVERQPTSRSVREIVEIRWALERMSETISEGRRSQVRFIGAVAHDLRSPLSAIRIAITYLERRAPRGGKEGEFFSIISRQVGRLERLINDLLDSIQISSGTFSLRRKRFDLVEEARAAVLLQQCATTGHEVKLDAPADPVEIDGDRGRFGQVLANLLSNATKYSPGGGTILVSVATEGDDAVLRVADEGIGMSEEDIRGIFEPFKRTSTSRVAFPGIGLGLSLVKGIVESHGGTITVASMPGEGSAFTVRIPRHGRGTGPTRSEGDREEFLAVNG